MRPGCRFCFLQVHLVTRTCPLWSHDQKSLKWCAWYFFLQFYVVDAGCKVNINDVIIYCAAKKYFKQTRRKKCIWVSSKTSSMFVFLTYSASLGARNFILDIFQHPTIDLSTVRERSSITSALLGGVGVLSQKCWHCWHFRGGWGV